MTYRGNIFTLSVSMFWKANRLECKCNLSVVQRILSCDLYKAEMLWPPQKLPNHILKLMSELFISSLCCVLKTERWLIINFFLLSTFHCRGWMLHIHWLLLTFTTWSSSSQIYSYSSYVRIEKGLPKSIICNNLHFRLFSN